jgi:hydrogenase maturation factor HypE
METLEILGMVEIMDTVAEEVEEVEVEELGYTLDKIMVEAEELAEVVEAVVKGEAEAAEEELEVLGGMEDLQLE